MWSGEAITRRMRCRSCIEGRKGDCTRWPRPRLPGCPCAISATPAKPAPTPDCDGAHATHTCAGRRVEEAHRWGQRDVDARAVAAGHVLVRLSVGIERTHGSVCRACRPGAEDSTLQPQRQVALHEHDVEVSLGEDIRPHLSAPPLPLLLHILHAQAHLHVHTGVDRPPAQRCAARSQHFA